MSEAVPITRKRDQFIATSLAVACARITRQLAQLVVFVFGARVLALHEGALGASWRRIAVKSVFLLPILLAMTVLAVFLKNQPADAHGLTPLVSLVVTALPAAILYLAGVAQLRAEALARVWRTLRRA